MTNIFFELDKLRHILKNKGLDAKTVELIVNKAGREITEAFKEQGDSAMQLAIEAGVAQRSPEFINELHLDPENLRIITESGNTDFSDPPFPMLPKLLQNAEPMKDGSGVYKVIPVGAPGKDRPKVSTNIYDAMKKVQAERVEAARKQYQAIAPKGAVQFRTATSKQDTTRQWVLPATQKDFTEQVSTLNKELEETMEAKIRDILRSYEEGF